MQTGRPTVREQKGSGWKLEEPRGLTYLDFVSHSWGKEEQRKGFIRLSGFVQYLTGLKHGMALHSRTAFWVFQKRRKSGRGSPRRIASMSRQELGIEGNKKTRDGQRVQLAEGEIAASLLNCEWEKETLELVKEEGG